MKGYVSELPKNILAYNLIHHLAKNLKLDALEQQELAATVEKILTNFEYKEAKINNK
jgi:UDP:flavonoid glycosyltransferase YjiC (YdhE family)